VASYLPTAPARGRTRRRSWNGSSSSWSGGLSVTAAFDAYQVLTGFVLNHVQRAERCATASRISRYAELGTREDLPLTALVAQVLPADATSGSAAGSA
jgi:hypothetical protein